MMMLLGSVIGLLGSALPKLFDFLKRRQDQRHELAMMDRQMEAQRILGQMRLEEVGIQGDIAATLAAHAGDQPTGIRWVDAMRGLVRPTITWAYFAFFVFVRAGQYSLIAAGGQETWASAINILWTDEDGALLGIILSYWFGGRMFSSARRASA